MTERRSFRQRVLRAREDAIVESVGRLLATKGFEAMTVDEIAADAGIAKASLYKHYPSKEALAAAAVARALDRALAWLDGQTARPAAPLEHLRNTLRWLLRAQLAGELPAMPTPQSTLRATLVQHPVVRERLHRIDERLDAWIAAAQAAGELDERLPPELVRYTLYARADDAVLGWLRAAGGRSDEELVALIVATCFEGLAAR